jgi:hypothetical protein
MASYTPPSQTTFPIFNTEYFDQPELTPEQLAILDNLYLKRIGGTASSLKILAGGVAGDSLYALDSQSAVVWRSKYAPNVVDCQPAIGALTTAINQANSLGVAATIQMYPGLYQDNASIGSLITLNSQTGNTVLDQTVTSSGNAYGIQFTGLVTINAGSYTGCIFSNTLTIGGTSQFHGCTFKNIVCSGGTSTISDSFFMSTGSGTALSMSSTASLTLNNFICPPSIYTTEITMGASNTLIVNRSQFDVDKLTLAGTFNLDFVDRVNQTGRHIYSNQYYGLQGSLPVSATLFGQGTVSLKNFACFRENVTLGTFSDISATMLPSSNTNNTLFPTLVNTERVYFGDLNRFSGFNMDIATAMSGGTFIWEYFNGAVWTPFTVMVSNSAYPYESYTINLGTVIQRQNIRFNNDILKSTTNWTANAVNGTTKFWVRYSETVNPAVSAVVKNLRLNGNQLRINPNGIQEMMGLCRQRLLMPFDAILLTTPPGGSTQNQNIFVGPTLSFTRTDNSMAVGDSLSGLFYLPAQTDTSSPAQLVLTGFSNGTDPDPFNFTLVLAITSDGEPLYLAAGGAVNPPRFATVNFSITPTINVISRQTTVQIPFDISLAAPKNSSGKVSDMISIQINRIADSNANRFIIAEATLSYLACFQGFSE